MSKPCPKCGYVRQLYDSHVMQGLCPKCGIATQKWLRREDEAVVSRNSDESLIRHEEIGPWYTRLKSILLYTPETTGRADFYGRVVVFILFFIWGWSFILGGLSWTSIGSSFLHSVNLPFHEFGHVLFSPFGRFMTLLGGSLFQVLMPLGLGIAFLCKYKNAFGASIMLWWGGQNFVDIAPYIADASFRTIPLIGGMGAEAHDWGNLLTMLGWLNHDYALGRASFLFGSMLMILANIWGGCLLYLQRRAAYSRPK